MSRLFFAALAATFIATQQLPAAPAITEYSLPSGEQAKAISPGADGNIWISIIPGNSFYPIKLARVTTSGSVTEFNNPLVTADPGQDAAFEADHLAIGPDGDLWASDSYHQDVARISANGGFTVLFYPTTTGGCPDTGCSDAGPMAIGADGNLWFGKYLAFEHVTSTGAFTEVPFDGADPVRGIVLGPDGNIWFTGYVGSDNVIGFVTTGGAITYYKAADFKFSDGTSIAAFADLVKGSDGMVWGEIHTSQNYSAWLCPFRLEGTTLHSDGCYALPSDYDAYALVATNDGHLWFGATEAGGEEALGEFSLANHSYTFYLLPGQHSIAQMTVGKDGNLWYTTNSSGSGAIGKVLVDGGTGSTNYTVTPSVGANGSISPNMPQTVPSGANVHFTITPDPGYTASVGGSCGGTLSGNIYTTNPITSNCTVSATFAAATTKYTVTPSAGANGSISPSTPQTVSSGATVQFTATPDPGYYTASFAGSCGGSYIGNSFSTNPITANCTVTVSFASAGVPNCTISASPTSLPSSGGNVALQATCSNSPTSYHFFLNGFSWDSSTSGTYTAIMQPNTTTTIQTSIFAVQASNAFGTGSVSAGVTVTVAAGSAHINLDQHGLTGSWFNPATSGQGLEVEVYQDVIAPGQGVFFAGWFTYDATAAGGRRWYALQGNVSSLSSPATLAIFADVGGNLNAPPSVVPSGALGQATIQFSDCVTGLLTYNFTDGSGRAGTIPLSRITPNVTCSPSGDNGMAESDFVLSGNWFNPNTSGQGLIFDFSPSLNLVFAAWYTFKPNGQQIGGPASQDWYTLQSDQFLPGMSSLANIPIVETSGGIFDNPATATTIWAGLADIAFQSCNAMTLNYRFTAGGNKGKTGSMNLVRVVPLAGCTLR